MQRLCGGVAVIGTASPRMDRARREPAPCIRCRTPGSLSGHRPLAGPALSENTDPGAHRSVLLQGTGDLPQAGHGFRSHSRTDSRSGLR